MWSCRIEDVLVSPTLSVGAAVVLSCIAKNLFTRQAEVESEIVAWILLPFIFGLVKAISRTKVNFEPILDIPRKTKAPATRSLWTIASAVAICSIYKAEEGSIGLWPTLSPILLIASAYLKPQGGLLEKPPRRYPREGISIHTTTTWIGSLVALLATFVLSSHETSQHFWLSTIAILAMLVFYITVSPKAITPYFRFPPHIDNIENSIHAIAWRVGLLLSTTLMLEALFIGHLWLNALSLFSLSLVKSLAWYFTIQTAQRTSWSLAPVIGTFSLLASIDPYVQTSEILAFIPVLVSVLVLGQVAYMLPKQDKLRPSLWLLLLIPLVPYITNSFAIQMAQSRAQHSFRHGAVHPTEVLTRNAKTNFDEMLQRQSKDYTTAEKEYRRRYRIEPPPGFQACISPLLRLSGKEIRQIMNDAAAAVGTELWMCDFSNQRVNKTICIHEWRWIDRNYGQTFNTLLKDSGITLPNLKFLVNHFDEPTVLIPPTSQTAITDGRFIQTDLSGTPTWDSITKYCASALPRTSSLLHYQSNVETYDLPFITDPTTSSDLCQHPEYPSMHGLFQSPNSFRVLEGLLPVLSTGSTSTMGDILFPSPAYIDAEFTYDPKSDISWSQKTDSLYWAGSTTGASAWTDKYWPSFHRQRFVTFTQNLQKSQYYYLAEHQGKITRVTSSFLNGRLYNVFFTRIMHCWTRQCRSQRSYFSPKSWSSRAQELQSRLVFDMDGNGISGRYYRLLASNSCPLKRTLFREWHDDRLIPWVHYIPVSLGLEEVPEIVAYLTQNEIGRKIAKEIAEQGKRWSERALRQKDLSVYMYRLLLEVGRLQDPGRERVVV